MKKHKFIVEIEIPEEANITKMKYYIHDSIGALSSRCNPVITLNLNIDSIKVVHATRAKAAELLEELKR